MSIYYTYPKFVSGALSGLAYSALLLTDSSPGFNAAHDFVDDLSNEVSAVGYSRQTIAGSVTSDANGAYFTPTAAYVEFPSMTANVQYAVIFADTSDDSTSRVVGIIEFDSVVALVAKKLRLIFSGALIEGAV
jgi:hypothetical protein